MTQNSGRLNGHSDSGDIGSGEHGVNKLTPLGVLPEILRIQSFYIIAKATKEEAETPEFKLYSRGHGRQLLDVIDGRLPALLGMTEVCGFRPTQKPSQTIRNGLEYILTAWNKLPVARGEIATMAIKASIDAAYRLSDGSGVKAIPSSSSIGIGWFVLPVDELLKEQRIMAQKSYVWSAELQIQEHEGRSTTVELLTRCVATHEGSS
jgi:hypothetical protein